VGILGEGPLKKVYVARDLPDAHLLKGLLEGIHIAAEVHGEETFRIAGQSPSFVTAPAVWILNDEDYGQAMELVSAFQGGQLGRPDARRPWRCSCGEENEGQFSECWNCGRSRPVFG
jgi:hypothetical protein